MGARRMGEAKARVVAKKNAVLQMGRWKERRERGDENVISQQTKTLRSKWGRQCMQAPCAMRHDRRRQGRAPPHTIAGNSGAGLPKGRHVDFAGSRVWQSTCMVVHERAKVVDVDERKETASA